MNDAIRSDGHALSARLRDVVDRSEIDQLISRHFLSPDDRRTDDAWLESLYTDDFALTVPTGTYTGREEMRTAVRTSALVFERSHHLVANNVIELDGDTASVRSKMIATHLQRADEPENAYTGGAEYVFDARRTNSGWRLARAEYIGVWTRGRPPAPPAEPTRQ